MSRTDDSRVNDSNYPADHPLSAQDMRMLAAIRHGIATNVVAETSSDMAKMVCDFSVGYIDKLLARYTAWPAILAQQNQRMADVLRQHVALLAEVSGVNPALLANARDTAQRALATTKLALPALEQTQRELDAALEQLVPLLLGDPRLRASGSRDLINQLLRDQVTAIRASEDAFNLAIKARVEQHGALVERQASVTREAVQGYLRDHYPERKDLAITAWTELVGGSSKSTILIEVSGFENDGATPLVVRLDRTAGTTDTRVIDEVPTLRKMFELGLPVPEVMLVEPDASKIGLAFIIVRKVDAKLGGNMWQPDPILCNADTARDLARILARLHTLDIQALGLRGALNSDPAVHPMIGLIDNIRGLWKQKKLEPDGTLEACLCWLEQHMPPAPAPQSLIHADVSFHNILVKDFKVGCLLDWELSHLGDPNEDLSYVRPCIEQLMPWQDFLAEYRKHGGGEFSEETGRYYSVWRDVRNAVYTLTGRHSFHTDANPDMRWGFYGTYYRMVLLDAANKVAEAGMRAN